MAQDGDRPAVEVRDNRDGSRFEAEVDGEVAFAAYEREDGRIRFTHTEVPKAMEGQGIGSALARAALDRARSEGLLVVPACPFISAYIRRHPEYQDLVNGAAGA